MRHCRDCKVFQNVGKYDSYLEEAPESIWCEEIGNRVFENTPMCDAMLTDRDLLNLLCEKADDMACTLHSIANYIEGVKARQRAKDEAGAREKWEKERPLRLEKFEKELAELPDWVKPSKAGDVTGLTTSTLRTYAKKGLLKCRTNDKGHREYLKDDILKHAEKEKAALEVEKWKRGRFL